MNIQNIIDRVKAHAKSTGKSEKSVLRAATGNALSWDRLLRMKSRAKTINDQIESHIQAVAESEEEGAEAGQ